MRDRWVALYIIIVLAQLPVYFALGEGPLKFDFATKDAENKLRDFRHEEGQTEAVERALQNSIAELDRMQDQTSRLARVRLNQAILAWKTGKPEGAVEALEKSSEIFSEKHGPDSFHTAAVDLRLAELFYLQRKYHEARVRYGRSTEAVRDYLGPRHPFVVRQIFREVCALVGLGRGDEAAELARANLPALKLVAEEQDVQFMASTGSSLDILHRQGKFGRPPEGSVTWKSYLTSLLQEAETSSSLRPKPGTGMDD